VFDLSENFFFRYRFFDAFRPLFVPKRDYVYGYGHKDGNHPERNFSEANSGYDDDTCEHSREWKEQVQSFSHYRMTSVDFSSPLQCQHREARHEINESEIEHRKGDELSKSADERGY
jgi:hypothetical protein